MSFYHSGGEYSNTAMGCGLFDVAPNALEFFCAPHWKGPRPQRNTILQVTMVGKQKRYRVLVARIERCAFEQARADRPRNAVRPLSKTEQLSAFFGGQNSCPYGETGHKRALTIQCPTCGAKPGACELNTGQLRNTPQVRRRLAVK